MQKHTRTVQKLFIATECSVGQLSQIETANHQEVIPQMFLVILN